MDGSPLPWVGARETWFAYHSRVHRAEIVDPGVLEGYRKWVCKLQAQGFDAYLLTLEFRPLRGGPSAMLDQMKLAIQQFYSRILTDIVRIRARRRPPLDGFPPLIAAPDMPVGKYNGNSGSPASRINDGIHWHAIMLIPRRNILNASLDQHIAAQHSRLVKDTALISIHAKPITRTPEKVVRYVMKCIERLRFGGDDIEILPKAWSEIGPKPPRTRAASPEGLNYAEFTSQAFSGHENG
jgi:hypothetical protein